MAVAILEGTIEETGNGVIRNGAVTDYEYIKIGGTRVRHIRCQNYLDSMIKPGKTVRLACVKSMGKHTVYAVQESNGEVSKNPITFAFINSAILVVFWAIVLFIPSIALFATGNKVTGTLTFFGGIAFFTWLATKSHYRARNALDNLPSPVPAA